MGLPCEKRLDAECFAAHPEWAQQAFAWRLLHLIFPGQITKQLPPSLAFPPLPPGFEWPPIIVIPPGTEIPLWWDLPEGWTPGDLFPPDSTIPTDIVLPLWWIASILFPPGTIFLPGFILPPGWQPGDPPPPGVVIPPGTVFPPGWQPGDPPPPGVLIPPGTVFPPGWQPGDPWPAGIILPPNFPPGWQGLIPPAYLDPGSGVPRPAATSPVVDLVEYETSIEGIDLDGWIQKGGEDDSWGAVHSAPSGDNMNAANTWYAYAVRVRYTATKWTNIARSFFLFFVNDIPSNAQIVSADFKLVGESDQTPTVCVMQGTQSDPLALGDFDSFTGPSFGEITIPDSLSYLTWPLNASGLSYLESMFGNVNAALFCVREYTYDFLNQAPTPGFPTIDTTLLFVEYFAALSRPILDITYMAE